MSPPDGSSPWARRTAGTTPILLRRSDDGSGSGPSAPGPPRLRRVSQLTVSDGSQGFTTSPGSSPLVRPLVLHAPVVPVDASRSPSKKPLADEPQGSRVLFRNIVAAREPRGRQRIGRPAFHGHTVRFAVQGEDGSTQWSADAPLGTPGVCATAILPSIPAVIVASVTSTEGRTVAQGSFRLDRMPELGRHVAIELKLDVGVVLRYTVIAKGSAHGAAGRKVARAA